MSDTPIRSNDPLIAPGETFETYVDENGKPMAVILGQPARDYAAELSIAAGFTDSTVTSVSFNDQGPDARMVVRVFAIIRGENVGIGVGFGPTVYPDDDAYFDAAKPRLSNWLRKMEAKA